MPSQNEMRARFHELGRMRDEAAAKAKPLRDEYEAMRVQECALRDKMAPVVARLKEAEAPLFEIDQERGALSRALNGKTGAP